MASPMSFQNLAMPSAIISDVPPLSVPLFAVSMMTLNQVYHLPPIAGTGSRAIAPTHDDTITLTGLLIGPTRYALKFLLETLAEASKRGSALSSVSGGAIGGLILVTSMTIRTDMHVQSLNFVASAQRRDAIEVTISMLHLPKPSALGKLLDAASVVVGGLADLGGN